MNLIAFEGRTVAVLAPEDLETLEAERDTLKRQVEVLTAFAKDCIDDFDCDSDAHKYGTMCRCCSADKILSEIEKKKGGGGANVKGETQA